MEGIQFDEPTYGMQYRQPQKPGLVGWLIKKGIAKDKQQAQYILIGVIVVAVAISIFAYNSGPTQLPSGMETDSGVINTI